MSCESCDESLKVIQELKAEVKRLTDEIENLSDQLSEERSCIKTYLESISALQRENELLLDLVEQTEPKRKRKE